MFLCNPRTSVLLAALLTAASCAGPAGNLNPCHGAFGTECGSTLFEEQPIESFLRERDEVYRCWLDPGWGMSDVVRAEKQGDTIVLTHKDYTKRSPTSSAVELGTDYTATQKHLSTQEWDEIAGAVEAAGFWDAQAAGNTSGAGSGDCPDYIAEGMREDDSRSFDARCPKPGTPARMCDALFAAAGISTGW